MLARIGKRIQLWKETAKAESSCGYRAKGDQRTTVGWKAVAEGRGYIAGRTVAQAGEKLRRCGEIPDACILDYTQPTVFRPGGGRRRRRASHQQYFATGKEETADLWRRLSLHRQRKKNSIPELMERSCRCLSDLPRGIPVPSKFNKPGHPQTTEGPYSQSSFFP